MTMLSLSQNSRTKYGLVFEHEKNGLDQYEDNSMRLARGRLPVKTEDYRLQYYQFSLTPEGATKQQISLCDVAGELFDTKLGANQMKNQLGFRYANAFIMLIDPLAIFDFRDEIKNSVNLSGYKGSTQPIDELVDTLICTLQNIFNIKANDILKTDVAVVFTKIDLPGLNGKIGEIAINRLAPSCDQKTRFKLQNELCEKFLRDYNEAGFLINLKSRFKSFQFFTCSALGHIENGQPFSASRVEEPFYWLVRKKSKVIDKVIRSKSIC
jgi:hypothetical protein